MTGTLTTPFGRTTGETRGTVWPRSLPRAVSKPFNFTSTKYTVFGAGVIAKLPKPLTVVFKEDITVVIFVGSLTLYDFTAALVKS